MGGFLSPRVQSHWTIENGPSRGQRLSYWLQSLRPRIRFFPSGSWDCNLPLWLFLLPMLIPTTRAWLALTSPTLCKRCHYDRAGLPADAVCPECGIPAPPAPPAAVNSPTPAR
jgi:hypothetical protein